MIEKTAQNYKNKVRTNSIFYYSAALNNAEVVSLVISETAGSLRVVPSHSQINNVVKRAIDQFLAPKIKPQEAPVSTKK
jgi:hypothetical protein